MNYPLYFLSTSLCYQSWQSECVGLDVNEMAQLQPDSVRILQLSAAGIRSWPKWILCNCSVYAQQLIAQSPIMYWMRPDVPPRCCVSRFYTGLKSAEPDKGIGWTVHSQISHEVNQLLDIKSQRGGGQERMNPQDVFPSVMITLLAPSFEKGISSYCDYTSYQGKERHPANVTSASLCVFVCVCLWWIIHSQMLLCRSSTAVQEGTRPSQVIAALSGHSRHSPALVQMCVLSARTEKTWKGNFHRAVTATHWFLKTI